MAITSPRRGARKAPQRLFEDEKPKYLCLKSDPKPLTCSICMTSKKKVSFSSESEIGIL